VSHYAYVIAATAEEASNKVRTYILATHTDRWLYERWSLCFKGEPDAREMLREELPNKPDARLWKVALAVEPVDVPRETSAAPDGSVLVKGYALTGVETEVVIPRAEAAALIERDKGFDMRVISNVYVKLGDLFDALGAPDVPRETKDGDS